MVSYLKCGHSGDWVCANCRACPSCCHCAVESLVHVNSKKGAQAVWMAGRELRKSATRQEREDRRDQRGDEFQDPAQLHILTPK